MAGCKYCGSTKIGHICIHENRYKPKGNLSDGMKITEVTLPPPASDEKRVEELVRDIEYNHLTELSKKSLAELASIATEALKKNRGLESKLNVDTDDEFYFNPEAKMIFVNQQDCAVVEHERFTQNAERLVNTANNAIALQNRVKELESALKLTDVIQNQQLCEWRNKLNIPESIVGGSHVVDDLCEHFQGRDSEAQRALEFTNHAVMCMDRSCKKCNEYMIANNLSARTPNE